MGRKNDENDKKMHALQKCLEIRIGEATTTTNSASEQSDGRKNEAPMGQTSGTTMQAISKGGREGQSKTWTNLLKPAALQGTCVEGRASASEDSPPLLLSSIMPLWLVPSGFD